MYTDQTRKFPVASSQGNRYIMVLYEWDNNLILVEPIKTWALGEMHRAYNKSMVRLTERGIKVIKHILDNKALDEYLQEIKCNGIQYEKVPLNIHRRNIVEKAISTFKDHFQAILAGFNSTFTMHLWDGLC